MDYLEQCVDLRRPDSDPELFALALTIRHIRWLIDYGGSVIGRQDDNSALNPHHWEVFINRAVEKQISCLRMALVAANAFSSERSMGERANIIPGSIQTGKKWQERHGILLNN
jgi:hypothetical protein